MSATEIKEEKEFEMKLLELEKSIDEKAPALKSLQAEVDSLQKQIGEIGGPKLKNAQHQSKIELQKRGAHKTKFHRF